MADSTGTTGQGGDLENVQRFSRPSAEVTTRERGLVCVGGEGAGEACDQCHATIFSALVCRLRDAEAGINGHWRIAEGQILSYASGRPLRVLWQPSTFAKCEALACRVMANVFDDGDNLRNVIERLEGAIVAVPEPSPVLEIDSNAYCDMPLAAERTERYRRTLGLGPDQYIFDATPAQFTEATNRLAMAQVSAMLKTRRSPAPRTSKRPARVAA